MRWKTSFPRAMLLALFPLAAALPVAAQSVVSSGQSFVQGTLLPGSRQADGSRLAGLSLRLAEGWKTYWRNPGQTGLPPQFDWNGSKNVLRVEVMWPRPVLFRSFGMRTVGYSGQVVLPIRIVPKDASRAVHLKLAANVGVCKQICVIEQFTAARLIEADLREGVVAVAQARAAVPPDGRTAGLIAATCRVSGSGKKRILRLRLAFRGTLKRPVVLVEGTEKIWVTGTASRKTAAGTVEVDANLRLASAAEWIDRRAFRMTVLADNMSADIKGCTAPAG